jgi:mono/diheme cytochrome c family protein
MAFVKGLAVIAAIVFFFGHDHARSHASRTQERRGESSQGDAASGPARARVIFEQRCAKCHGLDGRGQTQLGVKLNAPDFTDREWQQEISDARIRASITNGNGDMPAFGSKLSRDEIASLVAHVRGFAPARR